MSITRRQIFEHLTLARTRELLAILEINGLSSLNKAALIDKLPLNADMHVGWISAAHPPKPFRTVVTRKMVDALRLSTLLSKEAMEYEPISTRRCSGRHVLFHGGDL